MTTGIEPRRADHAAPTFRDAFGYWVRLGFTNFGGPAGQISMMHDEIVERRQWLSHERFMHALNYCMLLPGPEAQQLAIYIGWLFHRTLGGIVAGVAFILPGVLVMLGLSILYVTQGDVGWAEGIFFGLQAAVIAIVALAVQRVGKRSLKNVVMYLVAGAAFISIFMFAAPFPLVVLAALILGLVGGVVRPDLFLTVSEEGSAVVEVDHADTSWGRALRVLMVGLAVWWGPLLAMMAWGESVFAREAVFFSQAAMVTFGGAYAVLSYLDQAAVTRFGWLQPGQMLTGLGLAETTPGPLILVTQFVGFVAAYNFPGSLPPLVAGTVGAAVTVWATFVPCFLWIFLGAPFIEKIRGNRALTGGLSTVTSAVVGVLLNLSIVFALRTLFTEVRTEEFLGGRIPVPDLGSISWEATFIALGAALLMSRAGWSVIRTVAVAAATGLLLTVL
ncbi:MAG: chromate efflux transporter [Actinomycetota bacterium]